MDTERHYGITESQYYDLWEKQGGSCGVCSTELHREHINGVHVDHDHATGRVRGLLCGECNTMEGKLGGAAKRAGMKTLREIVVRLTRYLEEPPASYLHEHIRGVPNVD